MTEHDEGDLFERILEEGEVVFQIDSGASSPGMGSTDIIMQHQDHYYLVFEGFNPEGPYESIIDAIESSEIAQIRSMSVSFRTDLPTEELVPRLTHIYDETELPFTFTINDEVWQVNEDNTITRVEP